MEIVIRVEEATVGYDDPPQNAYLHNLSVQTTSAPWAGKVARAAADAAVAIIHKAKYNGKEFA